MPSQFVFDFPQTDLIFKDKRVLLQRSSATLELVNMTNGVLNWHILSTPDMICSCHKYLSTLENDPLQAFQRIEPLRYRHILSECASTDIEIASLVNNSTGDSSGWTPDSAVIAYSPDVSLDSDILSMSDTSEEAIIRPLGPKDILLPIISSVACRLLREYRSLCIPKITDNPESARDNDGPNNNGSSTSESRNPHTSNSSVAHPVPNQGSQGLCPKGDRSEGSEDTDGEDSRKQRFKRIKPEHCDREFKLLACPFWKLDPSNHRGCFRMKLTNISRVKQHLGRNHTPTFYCERCLVILGDEESHKTHIRHETCSWPGPSAKLNGISHTQHRELSRKFKSDLSEPEKWFSIWDIVFPDHPRPRSPYMDLDLSNDLCDFLEYAQNRGPAMLTDELRASGLAPPLPLSEGMSGQLESVIDHGLNALFEQWLTRRNLSARSTTSSTSFSRASFPVQNGGPAGSSTDSGIIMSDGSSGGLHSSTFSRGELPARFQTQYQNEELEDYQQMGRHQAVPLMPGHQTEFTGIIDQSMNPIFDDLFLGTMDNYENPSLGTESLSGDELGPAL